MKRFIKRCIAVKKLRLILITGATIITLLFTYSFVDSDFKILKNLDIYYTLFRELNLYYVDNTDPEKLVKTSIDAMLESLDPYTVFIPESEQDDYKFLTTGEYGGIGALIRKNNDYFTISEIWENSPAYKAGIKVGDVILDVNGIPVSRKTNSEINELLKGEPKTEIELTLEHPGQFKTFKVLLVRERISISNVPYYGMVTETVGYIKQTNFTNDAHIEVRNALMQLKARGAKGIILDLRGNPGGLLVEAVGVTNLFVEKGQEIVHTKGKVKQWDNIYKTKNQPFDAEIPLTILVNRSSASAAEIVAGSLQDLDRAVIIGNRTFGKGLVQTTRPLSYNTQLKVTTAKYYTPSGRCIQALDYAHREPDGSVGYIPDSLISEFSTKIGRKVYDGGGIMPDIMIRNEPLSKITINLYARSYIFNFATNFTLTHDSIFPIPVFKITDADYENFVTYLTDKKFDYQTETEEAFIKLSNTASQEKYLEEAKDEFKALAKKLTHDKMKDLAKYKEEISELLKEEIVSRYYFQRGRIETSLSTDTHVIKAIEVLSSKQLYTGILDGTFKTIFADTRKGKNQND
jgi:carboxyl-terminal processing protease